MMLSMIYMNLRCNDAADAFCKNIPVRRQCGRIYLVFSLDCWGSGGLGLFTASLMWTDEVGRWLFRNVHHILQYVVEWTLASYYYDFPCSGVWVFWGFFFFLLEDFGKSEG